MRGVALLVASLVGTLVAHTPHRGCAAGGTAGAGGTPDARAGTATDAGAGEGGTAGDDPYAAAEDAAEPAGRDGGGDRSADSSTGGGAGEVGGDGGAGGAEPDDEGRRTAKERAQQLMSRGVSLLRRAAYAPALVQFHEAYRLYPSPKLLLNMGTTLRLLGRNAEALDAYDRYRQGKNVDPARLAELKPVVEDLYRRVAGVTVFIDDDAAIARLDGRPLASLDGSRWIWLEPGEHVLLVERSGRPSKIQVLRMEAGDRRNLVIELEREPTPQPRSTPSLRTTGTVLGAVGMGGVAVAAGLGITALVLDRAAAEHCHPDAPNRCDDTGANLGAHAGGLEAASIATLATAATIGGVGLTLYLVTPADTPDEGEPPPLEAEIGPLGLVLRGRFTGL